MTAATTAAMTVRDMIPPARDYSCAYAGMSMRREGLEGIADLVDLRAAEVRGLEYAKRLDHAGANRVRESAGVVRNQQHAHAALGEGGRFDRGRAVRRRPTLRVEPGVAQLVLRHGDHAVDHVEVGADLAGGAAHRIERPVDLA